jgi:hypothetical protein
MGVLDGSVSEVASMRGDDEENLVRWMTWGNHNNVHRSRIRFWGKRVRW